MKPNRLWKSLILAVAVFLIVTACGDDGGDAATQPDGDAATQPDDGDDAATQPDDGDDAATQPDDGDDAATQPDDGDDDPSTADVRGVTDSEIRIGGIAEASNYIGIDDGAKARYERANREGGIHGRNIIYVGVSDDGSDSARNLDIAREFATRDDVFGLAPVATQSLLPATTDYLAAQHVPFVGWGFMPGFCGNDWAFGFNGCLVGDKEIQGSYLQPIIIESGKPVEDIKFAFQSEDGDAGKTALRDFGDICVIEGCEVVYTKSDIPLNAVITDYTPYVQAIIASEPDIVFVNVSFANAIGLTGALKDANFGGLMINFVTYAPGFLESQPEAATILEGVYVNIQIPPGEVDTPASAQMIADLEAIDAEPFISFGASIGYWSADVMVQMLEEAGEDLTPESFEAAINDGFTYETIEGGIGPVEYPNDHTAPRSCTALVKVEDGQYVEGRADDLLRELHPLIIQGLGDRRRGPFHLTDERINGQIRQPRAERARVRRDLLAHRGESGVVVLRFRDL